MVGRIAGGAPLDCSGGELLFPFYVALDMALQTPSPPLAPVCLFTDHPLPLRPACTVPDDELVIESLCWVSTGQIIMSASQVGIDSYRAIPVAVTASLGF